MVSYEKAIERLNEYNSEYKLLTTKDEWKNMTTKVKLCHTNCPNKNVDFAIWEDTLSHILNDKRNCPHCRNLNNRVDSLGRKITHSGCKGISPEEYENEIKKLYPNNEYTLVTKYKNEKTKIKVRHNSEYCNYNVFEVRPSHFKNDNAQCPICSVKIRKEKMKKTMKKYAKTHNEFIQEVFDEVGLEYTVLGIYDSCKEKIKIRHNCEECNFYEYEVRPRDFFTKENRCPKCAKKVSKQEKEVLDFINSFYNGTIITNDRTILEGTELDMYFPDLNLAIEYDGLFYHSDYKKDKNYHITKTKKCEEKGIQLIHLFSDEWNYKKDIVKSKIKHIMKCDDNPKIYARQCVIKEIEDRKIKKKFLDENHIQGGFDQSNLALGLYYEDELVSLMTIREKQYYRIGSKKDESKTVLEIARFANNINYRVIGGFGKLLKYFTENYECDELITYADRRWSKKDNIYSLYNKFVFEKETDPSYWYIDKETNDKRLNRTSFTKSKLIKKYPQWKDLSESKIMLEKLKYLRIWDCGNLLYRYNITNK